MRQYRRLKYRMKKNIFIFIDSLSINAINDKDKFKKYAPFLYKLSQNSLFFNNIYSQGPYTEAASKALMSGNDSLADNGYIRFINESKNNLFLQNKKNGFNNIVTYLPISIYSKDILNLFDKKIYSSFMNLEIYWEYRLLYYINKKNKKVLNCYDYHCISGLLNDIFVGWIDFLTKDSNKDYTLIKSVIKEYDFEKNLKIINSEFQVFKKNKIDYIDNLLSLGKNHILFKVDQLYNIDFVDDLTIKELSSIYKSTFKKIRYKQFFTNLFNKDNFRTLFRCKNKINALKNLRFLLLKSTKYIDNYKKELFFNEMPSCSTLLNKLFDEIKTNKENHCFYLQIEDLHGDPNFFSYDSNDIYMLKKEMNFISSKVAEFNLSDKGNILYYLSLAYIDECFKSFFHKMKDNDLMDEYRIIITADHGSSVIYNPVRENVVNNFFLENYRIPLFIVDSNFCPEIINTRISSKHILNFMNDSKDEIISKVKSYKDEIIIEYLGPGCPDLDENLIWYGWFSENLFLAAKCPLSEEFNIKHITQIYDLDKDQIQMKNIIHLFKESHLLKLSESVYERHNKLKKEHRNYCEREHLKK